jgi:hypothetical protein
LLIALLVGLLFPNLTNAEANDSPPFSFLRQNEDWSGFADEAQDGPIFERIKHLPLSDDGSRWASFGGTLRARGEGWESFGLTSIGNSSDTFSVWRLLAHGDFRLSPRFRAFVEIKSALSDSRDLPGGTRVVDADNLEVQQLFVDTELFSRGRVKATLRVGRQAFLLGRGRLVAPRIWANTLRSWDGLNARIQHGDWYSDLFWTRPTVTDETDLNRADSDRVFYGGYTKRDRAHQTLEFYILGFDHDDARTINGTTGPEDRRTFGARAVFAKQKPLTFEFESAFQSGNVGSDDVQAWMATAEATWRPSGCRLKPTVRLLLDVASGDDAAGGDVETFNQLFPLGHGNLGAADLVSRQNIIAPSLHVTVKPTDRTTLRLAMHQFFRESRGDGVYAVSGAEFVNATAGTSREIASELDVAIIVALNSKLRLEVGGARVYAGNFLEQAGRTEDLTFGYGQLEFRF